MQDDINIEEKINHTSSFPILRMMLVSFIMIILVMSIAGFILFQYRASIYKYIAEEYASYVPANQLLPEKTVLPLIGKEVTNKTEVPQAEPTVVSAVKRGKPAVVSIIVSEEIPTTAPNNTEKKQISSGSGFLISSDGLIVTNRHVVSDTNAVYDVLLNNGKVYSATVLARDAVYDIALVKIMATNLPFLELGDSDSLDVGQSVIAIGNALGELKNTVSVGVVSGLSRSLVAGDMSGMSERLNKVIQTDAAINLGNSGGPLLDLKGTVVGINVALIEGSSNVGFALPINSVKSAIASVRKTGTISRPYVGIRYVPITKELKALNNLPVDYGILVQTNTNITGPAVIPGSPADKAGILVNDIVLEIDGQKITQDNDFAYLIRGKNIGDIIHLRVLSKGIEKKVILKLEKVPAGL